MKKIKKVFILVAISLGIQLLAFWYLDKVVLSNKVEIISKRVEDKNISKNNDLEIIIPNKIEDLQVSYDGRNISYIENKNLVVTNLDNGEKDTIKFLESDIEKYRWVKNTNRILIVDKTKDGNSLKYSLSYYNINKKIKSNITHIGWGNVNSKISDLKMNTLTGKIYVNLYDGMKNRVYEVESTGKIKNLHLKSDLIKNIYIVQEENAIVFEDAYKQEIEVLKDDGNIYSLGSTKQMSLLGIYRDNIVVGKNNNEIIDNIEMISIGNFKRIRNYTMNNVYKNQIKFLRDKYIFYIYNNKNIIKDIIGEEKVIYKGKFLGVYDKGIISLDSQNHIIKKIFSKSYQ